MKKKHRTLYKYCTRAGFTEFSEYVQNQQTVGARKELQKECQELQMSCGDPLKDIILYAKEKMKTRASASSQNPWSLE